MGEEAAEEVREQCRVHGHRVQTWRLQGICVE